jgi:hypothetical protein
VYPHLTFVVQGNMSDALIGAVRPECMRRLPRLKLDPFVR